MLKDTTIRAAQAQDKQFKLNDGSGLYLLVKPAGKYWRYDYRYAGKRKTLALGVFPSVSLAAARKGRDDARALLDQGVDPSEVRKAKKEALFTNTENSFEVIAREWHGQKSAVWGASHSARTLRRLELDVFPRIGKKPVADLQVLDLLIVVRRVEGRGAGETAHRVLQSIGQVLRYAVVTGRAARDVSVNLRGALAPVRSKHLAAIVEPSKVGPMLRKLDSYEGSFIVACALRLAPLVFVRPGELRTARWEDIDLQAGEWRYLVTKTQTKHVVPLARQAIAILEELQPLTGRGVYVFPSARTVSPNAKSQRPMSGNAILSGMRSLGISKEEMSAHGFRAMARTIMDEVLGIRPDLIEHQLAHAVRDPLGRAYNRTSHLPARREMMQQWADYLNKLKDAGEQGYSPLPEAAYLCGPMSYMRKEDAFTPGQIYADYGLGRAAAVMSQG